MIYGHLAGKYVEGFAPYLSVGIFSKGRSGRNSTYLHYLNVNKIFIGLVALSGLQKVPTHETSLVLIDEKQSKRTLGTV